MGLFEPTAEARKILQCRFVFGFTSKTDNFYLQGAIAVGLYTAFCIAQRARRGVGIDMLVNFAGVHREVRVRPVGLERSKGALCATTLCRVMNNFEDAARVTPAAAGNWALFGKWAFGHGLSLLSEDAEFNARDIDFAIRIHPRGQLWLQGLHRTSID